VGDPFATIDPAWGVLNKSEAEVRAWALRGNSQAFFGILSHIFAHTKTTQKGILRGKRDYGSLIILIFFLSLKHLCRLGSKKKLRRKN